MTIHVLLRLAACKIAFFDDAGRLIAVVDVVKVAALVRRSCRFFDAEFLGNEAVLNYLVNIFALAEGLFVIEIEDTHLVVVGAHEVLVVGALNNCWV